MIPHYSFDNTNIPFRFDIEAYDFLRFWKYTSEKVYRVSSQYNVIYFNKISSIRLERCNTLELLSNCEYLTWISTFKVDHIIGDLPSK